VGSAPHDDLLHGNFYDTVDPAGSSATVRSRDLTPGVLAGGNDQQSPQLSRSRGSGSDAEQPRFISPNPHGLRQWFRAVGST
jgi:hypothetical protein